MQGWHIGLADILALFEILIIVSVKGRTDKISEYRLSMSVKPRTYKISRIGNQLWLNIGNRLSAKG